MEKRTQGTRLIFLIIYVSILFLVNRLAFGDWVPIAGDRGLWFYTGAASIILGNLLVTPFYTKPVDALSYSILAGTGIYLVNDLKHWSQIDILVFWSAMGFILLVLISALVTIGTKDSLVNWQNRVSKTCMIVADFLGNQRVIFSVVFIFALIVFHRESAKEMFTLSLAWVTLVIAEPDKHLWNFFSNIKKIWMDDSVSDSIGEIIAYQFPKISLVKQHHDQKIKFGTVLAYKDSHSMVQIGVSISYIGRDDGLLLRVMDLKVPDKVLEIAKKSIHQSEKNIASKFNYFQNKPDSIKNIKELQQINDIVGIVDQDTTVERLIFEVIGDVSIEEGRLVEVDINAKPVIYQILDGITREEIVSQKNKYGYARATAIKIGAWNDVSKKFESVKWLPTINSPVYIKQIQKTTISDDAIGHFPETNYQVSIDNIDELVTHNTAILGILGIGKSMLSIELVERMIVKGIKVICIDLTNQYTTELPEYIDQDWAQRCLEKLQEAGKSDADTFQDNPKEGGSLSSLIQALEKDIYEFIHDDKDHCLKVFNPNEFFATKQLSDPRQYKEGAVWKRTASLWEISPVEVTSLITETVLKFVKDKMCEEARVCLVYEEAHSLIPEWGSVADEGDKTATNRTARAILQGRKYGMGCLLITQRTANVTKTILNQCNTVFAMRTFDDTGKSFLSNYIGSEYTDRLSSLKARQAVIYGKASSCENPVLIRLNDREDFLKAFRSINPPPVKKKKEDTKDSVEETEHGSDQIDVVIES